jgi:hypothetical protein
MPQIDFGQAFSTPDENGAPKGETSDPSRLDAKTTHKVAASKFRRSRLGRSDWTNIIFVIIAILGGLFCAFYFFNGAQLLREAARWPREFLYGRPPVNDGNTERAQLAAALGLTAPLASTSGRDSGDPFSRVGNFSSSFSSPSSPSSPAAPGTTAGLPGSVASPDPGSLLSQLGSAAPGGDALMQSFNHAVADLARVAQNNAQRTVVVVQSVVPKTSKQASTRARNAAQNAANAVNSTAQASGTGSAAQQTAGSAAATAGRTANSTVNTTTGLGRSTTGSLGSTISRPGGGMGGVGGLGGGGFHAPGGGLSGGRH